VETILKFFHNTKAAASEQNQVISRTMRKIAVVSKYMLDAFKHNPDKLPQHGELWRCRIAKECHPGKNSGCFVVEPLERIEEKDLVKLVPGTFDIKLINKQLIIRPKLEYREQNWIMPLQHKRSLCEEHGAYCVIVELDPVQVESVVEDVRTHGVKS